MGFDGFHISGELATELMALVDQEYERQRKRLRDEDRAAGRGYQDMHSGNAYHLGRAMDEHAPRWMNMLRREQHRNGYPESTSAGPIPPAELDAFAELRRRILAAGREGLGAALRRLAEWAPDWEPEEYNLVALRRELDGWKAEKHRGELPFLSERYLYALLGKDAARTLLALVGAVAQAAGYEGLRDLRDLDPGEEEE